MGGHFLPGKYALSMNPVDKYTEESNGMTLFYGKWAQFNTINN